MKTPHLIGFRLRVPFEKEEKYGMVNLMQQEEPAMQEKAYCLMADVC